MNCLTQNSLGWPFSNRTPLVFCAVACLGLLEQKTIANPYTVAGFSWDSDNSFTIATGVTNGNNSTGFPALDVGSDEDFTIGRLLGFGTAGTKRRVTLGSNTLRNTIELSFSFGLAMFNQPGNDFVVYEQGDLNQPEAYAVAVRPVGSSVFSDFRYNVWDSQQTAGSATYIATGFDLSEFGLSAGVGIDAIRIMNMVNNTVGNLVDYVPTGGSGVVYTAGSVIPSGYELPIGFGATRDALFPLGEYDPDLVYVGVMSELAAVPEPTLAFMVGLGFAGVLSRRRRPVVSGGFV